MNHADATTALSGSQLRYLVCLHYTGYPVAAESSQVRAKELAEALNVRYGQDVYKVWDTALLEWI